jgi:GTP-binding protein YchF
MRLGIVGLPESGKSTIFQILTSTKPDQWGKKGPAIGTVRVPDQRVDALRKLIKPRKTVYARLEYILPRTAKGLAHDGKRDEGLWSEIRPSDALVHVVRNFDRPGDQAHHPREDLISLESEMIFADLVVVEKRIERIGMDRKRGKKTNDEELGLLEACLKVLEDERPLRDRPELARAPLLKGYALLSAKPVLTVFNNGEENDDIPAWEGPPAFSNALAVRGKLEMELSELSPEEAGEFLAAYDVESPAAARVIHNSCDLLGLVSFFTVVNDEVRCWLIPRETTALEAAGVIHSDMKKGFIRAEVLAYDDLVAAGSYQQAKKEARVCLEGKGYIVQDGDVIYFRFNV